MKPKLQESVASELYRSLNTQGLCDLLTEQCFDTRTVIRPIYSKLCINLEIKEGYYASLSDGLVKNILFHEKN